MLRHLYLKSVQRCGCGTGLQSNILNLDLLLSSTEELEDATKDDKSPTLESEARKVMEKVEEDVEEDGDEEESAERNEAGAGEFSSTLFVEEMVLLCQEKDLVPELEATGKVLHTGRHRSSLLCHDVSDARHL